MIPDPVMGGSGDDFTRDLIAWQNQVLADRELTPITFHVAYVIGQHLNRESGDAWPSQERIGQLLSVTRRGVQGAIDQLTARGHLHVQAPTGRKGGNRYRPIVRNSTAGEFSYANDGSHEPGRDANDGSHETSPNVNSGSHESVVDANDGSHKSTTNASGGAHETRFHANGGSPLMRTAVRTNHLNEPSEGDISLSLKSASKSKRSGAKIKPATSDDDFELWWLQFPKKVEKAATRKAYDRAITAGDVTHAELMAGVTRYAAERTGQDPKFTKHPATWLNKGCWADEAEAAPQPGGGNRRPSAFSAIEYAMARIDDE